MIKTSVKAWKPSEQELDALNEKIAMNIEMLQPTYEVFPKLKGDRGKKANISIPKPIDQSNFDELKCKICFEIPLEKFYTCTNDKLKS